MAAAQDHLLRDTPRDDCKRKLGIELWNWQLCALCIDQPSCDSSGCPWKRKESLNCFWGSYGDAVACFSPQSNKGSVLNSHDDLLAVVRALKAHMDWTRTELSTHCFAALSSQPDDQLTRLDQAQAIDLAASVVFSINCDHTDATRKGVEPFTWRPNVKAGEVLQVALRSSTESPMLAVVKASTKQNLSDTLNAATLVRNITGLRFETTDDLRCHLQFDARSRVLQVFQSTAMLKEVLRASQTDPNACAIPREVALEVCDTIYDVLFPMNNASQKILSRLISKHGFDKDLQRYFPEGRQFDTEYDDACPFFGHRLAILLDEMRDPSPANWFERLFDKGEKSVERRMFMATMIGVFITAISSVLSLIVSSYQAYLGYQQLKGQAREA